MKTEICCDCGLEIPLKRLEDHLIFCGVQHKTETAIYDAIGFLRGQGVDYPEIKKMLKNSVQEMLDTFRHCQQGRGGKK